MIYTIYGLQRREYTIRGVVTVYRRDRKKITHVCRLEEPVIYLSLTCHDTVIPRPDIEISPQAPNAARSGDLDPLSTS
jgi:hypothetical protein